jgi:phosphoribosylaminoimidazole carboxylase PurK protein
MDKMSSGDAILEAFVDFACEVSVIIARAFDGKKVAFPVVENRHENHILRETIAPGDVSDYIKKQAEEAAFKIADGIGLVGVLAIEMFVTKDDKILVNELAPRPHNSGKTILAESWLTHVGHWSIEGCSTSQFEQVVRSICGLPLGNVKILAKKVVMRNLLGFEIEEWKEYLAKENTHVHNYGKAEAREGRKMGHVTTLYYD